MDHYDYKPLPPRHIRIATLHPAQDPADPTIRITLRQAMFDIYEEDELDDQGRPIEDYNGSHGGAKPSLLSRIQNLQVGSHLKRMVKGSDHGEIHDYPLRPGCKKPRYEALSYAWGKVEGEPKYVMLSDAQMQQAYPFEIGENLFLALKRLRRQKKPRDVWVDQICINQNNSEEKSIQVQKMGAIYANADAVVAWIGEEDNESQLAFTTFDALGKHLSDPRIDPATPTTASFQGEPGDWWLPDDPAPDALEAAKRMLQRSWFERLWIRQEVALARGDKSIIVCGSLSMPWRYFRAAGIYITLVKDKTGPIPKPFPILSHGASYTGVILDHIALGRIDGIGASLAALREMSWGTKCKDERDRIYANRSLLDHADERKRIQADYDKKMPTVYQDAVVSYLLAHDDLMILNQCRWSESSLSTRTTPTWVPDWDNTTVPIMPTFFLADDGLKASVRLATSLKVIGNVLKVTGVHVDTISTKIALSDYESLNHTLDAFRDFLISDTRDLGTTYRTNPAGAFTLGDAYVLSLLACELDWASPGPTHAWEVSDDLSTRLQDIRTWMAALGQTRGDSPSVLPESLKECIKKATQHQTQLFRTHCGRIGLSWASAMEPGDCVWVLFGCDVPMLLRPVSSGSSSTMADGVPPRYQVVGPVFLPWYSNGEPILGELPPIWHRTYTFEDGEEFVKEIPMGGNTAPFDPNMAYTPKKGQIVKIDPRLEEFLSKTKVDRVRGFKTEWLQDRFVHVPFEQLESTLSERGVNVEQLDLM